MKNAQTVKHRLALLVLVAVAVAGCANARNDASGATPAAAASGAATPSATGTTPGATQNAVAGPVFLGTHYPSQGHTHLSPGEPDDFVYNSNPPTSGPHREIFNDAFLSPRPLPPYVQVHLLEHGNVLLQYNCSCPDVAAALGQIAMQFNKPLMPPGELQPTSADVQNAEDKGRAVIVAPYPHMKSKIALSAWTRLGTLSAVDKGKIESFITAHLGNPTE